MTVRNRERRILFSSTEELHVRVYSYRQFEKKKIEYLPNVSFLTIRSISEIFRWKYIVVIVTRLGNVSFGRGAKIAPETGQAIIQHLSVA